jgi:hypothetical protein
MRRCVLKSLVLVWAASFLGLAAADRPDDIYVRVENQAVERVARDAQVGKLGRELYRAQESANRSLQRSTGLEADNYYVWVCVGNQCLPVDPYTFSN